MDFGAVWASFLEAFGSILAFKSRSEFDHDFGMLFRRSMGRGAASFCRRRIVDAPETQVPVRRIPPRRRPFLARRILYWVVEGQSASLADLPDWGSTGLGVYRIRGSTGLGSTGLGRANPWRGVGSETPIGSAIVAVAAAIVTIANVVMAAVVEPQQVWSSPLPWS